MIVGEQGPAVVISAETAYWLERICRVSALRMRLRDGRHQRVSQELLELRRVAMAFDPALLRSQTEDGSSEAEVVRILDQEIWLSPVEAADLLGMTDSAVRMACREDRIPGAERVGGRWRITRQAVEDFKRRRAA